MDVDLIEYVASDTTLVVDEANSVIRNVRVLGLVSANGREYDRGGVKAAIPLYQGRVVNANHSARPGESRSVYDRCGWLKDVREDRDGGLRADLHYLKSHPIAGPLVEAARRNPSLFGLSHTARGRETQREGKTVIESIQSVSSVDIVAEPATVAGLHESRLPVAKKKLSELIECLCKTRPGYAGALKEMADSGVMSPGADMPEPKEDLKPDAGRDHTHALRDAMKAILDDEKLSDAEIMGKIKAILKMLKKGGDVPAGEPDGDEGAEESKRTKARLNLMEAANEAGVRVSKVVIEGIRSDLTADQAKALVAELKGSTGGNGHRPGARSATPGASGKGGSTAVTEEKVPDNLDASGVGKWVTGG